jgi:hypothetical protein
MTREGSSGGSAIVGFLLGLVVASLGAAVIVLLLRGGGPFWIDPSRPAVVHQIQQLRRLETVVFGMDKVVSGGWESRYLPAFLAGERLLLIVYGEVTAGVDLGRISVEDVIVSDRAVRIAIPEAEVFSTRIDNARTRVYSRETGLFSRVDPELESNVRREAEGEVGQAALDAGILQVAGANARSTLTTLLHGLGFDEVEVQ